MPTMESSIKESHFANCDYGCPCQFNALPTDGTCRAVVAWQIGEGYCGDVRLFITPFGGSLNSSAANLTAVATLKTDGGFN